MARAIFFFSFFFFNDTATTEIYTLSLHDALPIFGGEVHLGGEAREALDHGAADRRGVERGAAGDEYDALEGADRGGIEVHVGQDDGARPRRQAAPGRVGDRAWPLVDLLEQ